MSNPAFLEQVLNVIHAVDVCHLQQFTDFCSTGVFFRASILSGHIFFLHPDASILHLSGGLRNYWDGLQKKKKMLDNTSSKMVLSSIHLDFQPVASSHILQIFLRIAIQNQIDIAQWVIVDEVV